MHVGSTTVISGSRSNVRLLATDLGGTLLTRECVVSARAVDAAKPTHRAGILVEAGR